MITGWAAALVAAVVCACVIGVLRRSGLAQRLADHPNERSLHRVPVPRVGGLGILAGALPLALVQESGDLRLLGFVVILLALLSLADDLRALPAAIRLAAHVVAAAMVVVAVGAPTGLATSMPAWAPWVAVVGIAWMTNLFNFMDGADGLAGGMAVLGFGALAWAAADAGEPALFVVTAALSGASLGFLAFNFPPARVFMGDVGSIPLGFLAGSLGWLGWAWGAWPIWFPVMVFSPFVADASVTLAIRLLRREPLFRAHRSHAYQQLVLGGWSHRRLALSAWPLMAACAASALVAREAQGVVAAAIIVGWFTIHAIVIGLIRACGKPGAGPA